MRTREKGSRRKRRRQTAQAWRKKEEKVRGNVVGKARHSRSTLRSVKMKTLPARYFFLPIVTRKVEKVNSALHARTKKKNGYERTSVFDKVRFYLEG